MWDQRVGQLARERLREDRAAAEVARLARPPRRAHRPLRLALGAALVRWGNRLAAPATTPSAAR